MSAPRKEPLNVVGVRSLLRHTPFCLRYTGYVGHEDVIPLSFQQRGSIAAPINFHAQCGTVLYAI